MLSSKDIKKLAKKIIRQQQGLHDIEIMHPAREWYTGLLVSVVLLVVSTIWSASTYLTNRNIEIEKIDESEIKTVVYREDAVQKALAEFEKKAVVREQIVNSTTFDSPVVEETGTSTEDIVLDGATTTASTTDQEQFNLAQ